MYYKTYGEVQEKEQFFNNFVDFFCGYLFLCGCFNFSLFPFLNLWIS